MANQKRYLLLEVEEARYEELKGALNSRSYVKAYSLPLSRKDREGNTCRMCYQSFPKSKTITVTESIVNALHTILLAVNKYKMVVIVDDISKFPPLQKDRCLVLPAKDVSTCIQLGLLSKFIDGAQDTYFISKIGLDFLSGTKKLTPSKYILTDGLAPEPCESIHITEIKFKDPILKDKTVSALRTAIYDMPEHIKNFILNGQLVLI